MLIITPRLIDDFGYILKEIPYEKRHLITGKKGFNPEMSREISSIFKEIILVDNYFNTPEVEIKALEIYKRHAFSKIITSAATESDILRSAKLRDYLKLEGQNYESALTFRDKILMKELVLRSNFKTPYFSTISSYLDLKKFIDIHGYPVVVKPRRESSTIGTRVIKNYHDLLEHSERWFGPSHFSFLMVETFVKGKMYHIDGLVIDNNVIAWPSKYVSNSLQMLEGKYFANYLLSPENPLTSQLISYAKRLICCFPKPKNIAFHLEVFQNKNNDIIFCEIASRVGGGYIERIWQEAFDVSLRESFYRFQSELPLLRPFEVNFRNKIPASVVFPKKTGIVEKISSKCELEYVSRYITFAGEGDKTESSKDTSSAILSSFIVGLSEKDVQVKINKFVRWVNKTLLYNCS